MLYNFIQNFFEKGKNNMTIQDKVLKAFQSGKELTSEQISSRFGAGNPQAVVQSLRFAGYPVYLNTRKNGVKKYRLGTPSRRVISAGYKAIAKGLINA
jgi:hypothetical protein|tara:strand:+ start:316 stop:609 length:294 start_codon:yes stop_codon:yes gene_type:complete